MMGRRGRRGRLLTERLVPRRPSYLVCPTILECHSRQDSVWPTETRAVYLWGGPGDWLTLGLAGATVGDNILRGEVPRDTDLNLTYTVSPEILQPTKHMLLAQPSPSVMMRPRPGVRPQLTDWPPGGGERGGGGQHCRGGGGDVWPGLTEKLQVTRVHCHPTSTFSL